MVFGQFFGFARFLFFLACGLFLVYMPLTIPQMSGDYSTSDDSSSCGFSPCAFLLGGFYQLTNNERDEWLAIRYVGCSTLAALIALYLSLRQWASFDREFQQELLEEQLQKRKYARVAFLCWDFRLHSASDKESFGPYLTNQFNALNEEVQLLKEDGKRRGGNGFFFMPEERLE